MHAIEKKGNMSTYVSNTPKVAREPTRTVFIASLNGQSRIWRNSLSLECDRATDIFQTGNLIGLESWTSDTTPHGTNRITLRMIEIYRATFDNWHQLAGTHEIAALNEPHEWTGTQARHYLRDQWLGSQPHMFVAAESRGRLVTHGGLTYGEWKSIGSPDNALETANRLNEKYAKTLYQGPCLKLGDAPNLAANPIWADPYMELYPSWVTTTEDLPFDQIYGSGSLSTERGRRMLADEDGYLRHIGTVRFRTWGTVAGIRGRSLIAIDLGLTTTRPLSTMPPRHHPYVERDARQIPLPNDGVIANPIQLPEDTDVNANKTHLGA